jgi:ADP-ribosylglycohydrolase
LPFEAQKPSKKGSITELPPILFNKFLDIPSELRGTKGIWSDDTHLSLASTISLIRSGGFDLNDQARAHIDAYRHVQGINEDADFVPPIVTLERNNGFGGSTVRSIGRLSMGIDPLFSGELNGGGNGVLMKLAPLVYWQHVAGIDGEAAEKQIIAFTKMTHNSDDAVVCSLVHAAILNDLLMIESDEQANGMFISLYGRAVTLAEKYEAALDTSAATSTVLKRLLRSGKITRKKVLGAAEKGGFYAPETLLMAYGSFLIEPEFPASVHRAAELGGDSDSVASIVATMSLFYQGTIRHPNDMRSIFAIERLERISVELAQAALQN